VNASRLADFAHFVRHVQHELQQRDAAPELAPREGAALREHFCGDRHVGAAATTVLRLREVPRELLKSHSSPG
jgi:hypothetical protein